MLIVTTLEDYDPRNERPVAGSLRAAVATRGPRLIVFRVAGNIELKCDLVIDEPFITIAGQTAPGEGVCLVHSQLNIEAPQVIIRYLRVRPGDVQGRELDCISCHAQNVILDHCSASWGIDETISTNGNSAAVTVSWCLIVESLNESVHHKGSHGYGSLISGPGQITYHHNVYAFHRSRSPRGGDVTLDFRNNLVYGWGDRAGYSGDDRLSMNYVGNYLRPLDYSKAKTIAFSPGGLHQKIYMSGNLFVGQPAANTDNWLLIKPPTGSTPEQAERAIRARQPFATATVTTQTAAAAYDLILRDTGATLPARDAVDTRVLANIAAGRGRLINSQSEVGGWPQLAAGAAPADSDGDGMSDSWERTFGLDPQMPVSTSHDSDGDGYADIEEFLNATSPTVADAWIDPPAVSSTSGDAFLDNTRVTLVSRTPAAELRYTLDGSEPSDRSTLYREPFELNVTAMLRAKAFVGGRASHVRNARLERLAMREPTAVAGPAPVCATNTSSISTATTRTCWPRLRARAAARSIASASRRAIASRVSASASRGWLTCRPTESTRSSCAARRAAD